MPRLPRRALAPLAAGLAAPALAQPAFAQAESYPSKPIRIVVPYAPGGTTDIAARLLGEQLGKRLGTSVVIENKPGANSIIGAGSVASSPGDGYALVMVIGAHAANATLFAGRLPFDPVKDFAPVSHVVSAPLILAGSGRSPVASVPALLEAARKNPGGLNYGSSGVGSAAHLTMEDLQVRTGTRLTHVPYRGTQPALQDLLAGNIAAMFDTYSTLKPQIDAGSIRALGIASRERARFAPEIPTFAEAGLANFASSTWCLLLAPAATPAPVVQRLSAESAAILREPAMAAKLEAMGFEVVGSDPAQAGAFLQAEVERWGRVIRTAHVVVE